MKLSEEVKEAIRLCNNVIENADYMEYKYMKEYKKSSIDILVKEIERLHSIIKEVREEIIKDRKKNYSVLEKKAFYCNKTDKLLKILGSDIE